MRFCPVSSWASSSPSSSFPEDSGLDDDDDDDGAGRSYVTSSNPCSPSRSTSSSPSSSPPKRYPKDSGLHDDDVGDGQPRSALARRRKQGQPEASRACCSLLWGQVHSSRWEVALAQYPHQLPGVIGLQLGVVWGRTS